MAGPAGQARRSRVGFVVRLVLLVWLGMLLFGTLSGLLLGMSGRFRGPGPPGPFPFPGFLLPLGFIGLLLVGRAVRRYATPIADVMDAAERVAAGDYGVSVAERGPREVRDLIAQFNAMTRQLGAHDAQRRRLLSDIAHELRTPLSVVRGNVEAMLDGVYPRDDAHLEPLVHETQVMARLLEDLRTLSLVDSGALHLDRRPVDLVELARSTVAAQRAVADAAGVSCTISTAGQIGPVPADPDRIRQVLSNLLSNALRHTPRGGSVGVQVAPAALPDGRAGVAVTVTDTGAGVDPDVLPRMFDRYARSDRTGGTGLGLAVSRDLIEAHRGVITAHSEGHDRGATVRFVLPAA